MTDAISGILSQIRAFQSQVAAPGAADTRATAATGNGGFGQMLTRALGDVDRAQHESTRSARAVELGESGASLAQAMLAAQEARVGLKAVVEVRNRLVQAYQDVLNMPL